MTGLAYGVAVVSNLAIFNNGNNTNGNKATTGIGIASVTHQVIIKPAIASTFAAVSSTLKGLTTYKKREITMPASSEMNLICNLFNP